jgi:hypothetical protein
MSLFKVRWLTVILGFWHQVAAGRAAHQHGEPPACGLAQIIEYLLKDHRHILDGPR